MSIILGFYSQLYDWFSKLFVSHRHLLTGPNDLVFLGECNCYRIEVFPRYCLPQQRCGRLTEGKVWWGGGGMDRQGSVVVGTSVWIFWSFLVCFDTFVHYASRLNHMVQSLFHFQVFSSLLQKCWFYSLSLLWKTCFTYCPYDVMPNVLTQTCFMTSYITCLPKLVLWW